MKKATEFEIKSLKRNFVFPKDTTFDSVRNEVRRDSIFGIDISHYTDSKLRFDLLSSQNVRFVYAKATQGVTFKDPKFGTYWKTMDALPADKKVLRGAYHFLSADSGSSALEQADRFVAYVNLHGGIKETDLPPVMDLEWDIGSSGVDRWKNLTPDQIVTKALTWLNRVQELTGRAPMVYTARSWWRERKIPESDIAKFSNFRIWIADYSNSSLASEVPAVPAGGAPDLWQFSDKSTLSIGYGGNLDANIFKGTEEQFFSTFFIEK